MPIRIREAEPEDANIIVQLIFELAATAGEVSSISRVYVQDYLRSAKSKILLAEVDREVVGLMSYSVRPDLYHAGDCCLIEELIVHEAVRGQGVGSALLSELFSQRKDWVEVSLGVMPENAQAIQFYQKLGLVEEALLLEKHFDRSE